MRTKFFALFLVSISLFTYFSYMVAKERFQQIDFDTTVKLQDHISGRFDQVFSYFSLLGSAEVTIGFCLLMMVISLLHKRFLPILGWLLIVPATMAEIFGKLVVFHPGPPQFFHRSLLPTTLPSFYVHTNFSYPSGHMTRTIFIITVVFIIVVFSSKHPFFKLIAFFLLVLLAFLMGLTRVYLGEHWLSDVLGGAILGLATGFLASVLIHRQAQDQH